MNQPEYSPDLDQLLTSLMSSESRQEYSERVREIFDFTAVEHEEYKDEYDLV